MVKYAYPFPSNIKSKKHTGEHHTKFIESRFAVDFPAPLGTPILATRSGKVVALKKDSNKFISDPKIISSMSSEEITNFVNKYTNRVYIAHSDGSYGEYGHLDKNVPVKKGQKINVGEIIGYVGMTGLTTEPHLHFNVFKVRKGKGESIPIQFKD